MYEVLHVFKTYYPDTHGGMEKVISTIATLTKDEGFHHSLLTLSPIANPKVIHFEEIDVYRAPTVFSAMSCPVGDFRSIHLARKLIAKSDLVVWHYPWPWGDILNLLAPRKPSIILYQSDIVKQRKAALIYEPLRRIFFSRADRIVATTPQYVSSSPILSKISSSKLRIIPLSVAPLTISPDENIFARVGLNPDEIFVLFVGALRYYKGLNTLIKAAQEIQGKIVIAGTGTEEHALHDLAKRLKVNNVIFTGSVSEAEKEALLMHASVFAFPSCQRSEAFGMALAEAAMHSIPMVSCRLGTGTSYVNQDTITGLEVDVNDPPALSEAINKIISSPSLSKRFSANARRHWEENLSPRKFKTEWINLMKSLLNQ